MKVSRKLQTFKVSATLKVVRRHTRKHKHPKYKTACICLRRSFLTAKTQSTQRKANDCTLRPSLRGFLLLARLGSVVGTLPFTALSRTVQSSSPNEVRNMKRIETEILVIGGGATGTGIAWDAALRGFKVVLVEKRDLTHGTTGRYHGLLHSGGRYVVKDPQSADECILENRILRKTHTHCIEDTSGFFVVTPEDEGPYPDKFVEGCRATGVDCARNLAGRGAAPRAAAQPAHQPRLRGARRLSRQLPGHPRHGPGRPPCRRADPDLPRADGPDHRRAATATGGWWARKVRDVAKGMDVEIRAADDHQRHRRLGRPWSPRWPASPSASSPAKAPWWP